MGWAVGKHNGRWIGYGVPAYCDHPGCGVEIDRGLAYVCGHEVYGGEHGCGLFFCEKHRSGRHSQCERCAARKAPFDFTPDHPAWITHLLWDHSWAQWRRENPHRVAELKQNHPALSGPTSKGAAG